MLPAAMQMDYSEPQAGEILQVVGRSRVGHFYLGDLFQLYKPNYFLNNQMLYSLLRSLHPPDSVRSSREVLGVRLLRVHDVKCTIVDFSQSIYSEK